MIPNLRFDTNRFRRTGLAVVCGCLSVLARPYAGWGGVLPIVQPVSVMDAGLPGSTGAHGFSGAPTYSGDGRTLLFFSNAADLVPDVLRLGVVNAWVRDEASGMVAPVSVTLDGLSGADGDTSNASISRDGRRVAFASVASNLVLGDLNGVSDIFVRDLDRGATRRLSVDSRGGDANGASFDPSISADGESVVFRSFASSLLEGSGGADAGVYQAILSSGDLRRLDVRPDGTAPNAGASLAIQNTNGTVVVIRSAATNLVKAPAGLYTDLFVHRDGSTALQPILLPGTNSDLTGPTHAYNVCLSADGRYLAFRTGSDSTTTLSHEGVWWFDLGASTNSHASGALASVNDGHDDGSGPEMTDEGRTLVFQVWTAVGASGVLQPSLRVWNALNGIHLMSDLGSGDAVPRDPATATDPVLSRDGGRVAYWSAEAHPAAGVTTAGSVRLYVRTLATGVTRAIARAPRIAGEISSVEFSPNATRLAFEGSLTAEDPGPLPRRQDVFEAAVDEDRVDLISAGRAIPSRLGNFGANFTPGHGGISDDGTRILFQSNSDNLVAGDTNGLPDAFVRDLNTGRTLLASAGGNGKTLDAGVRGAVLSGDGRSVAFVSTSLSIQPGDLNPLAKVFVRNLDTGITVLASAPDREAVGGTAASQNPQISRDGSRVLFEYGWRDLSTEGSTGGFRNLYLRDLPSGRTFLVNRDDPDQHLYPGSIVPGSASLSRDGTAAVFLVGSIGTRGDAYAYLIDSNRLVRLGDADASDAVRQVVLSGDATRAVVAAVRGRGESVVVILRELNTGVDRLVVSVAFPGLSQPFPISDLLISADGSRVFFRSTVDPIFSGTPRGGSGVFAYTVATGGLQRVDSSSDGAEVHGFGDSLSVSADGRFAAFRSRADDMAPGDTNRRVSDVFVKDLTYGTTRLISRSPATGYSGNQLSVQPMLSADGSHVAFLSFADDLTTGDFNELPDVFVSTVPKWLHLEARRLAGNGGAGAGEIELQWAVPLGVSVQVQQGKAISGDIVWTVALAPSAGGEGVETAQVVDGGIERVRRIGISATNTFYRLATSVTP